MNIEQLRAGAKFQVQTSRDGETWNPQQPHPGGIQTMVPGGDHWFTDHHEAWVAANRLRSALTWSEVRLVVMDRLGNVVGTQVIL